MSAEFTKKKVFELLTVGAGSPMRCCQRRQILSARPPQLRNSHNLPRLIHFVTPAFHSLLRPIAQCQRHTGQRMQNGAQNMAPVPLIFEQHLFLLRHTHHFTGRHLAIHRRCSFHRRWQLLRRQVVFSQMAARILITRPFLHHLRNIPSHHCSYSLGPQMVKENHHHPRR